MPAPGTSARHGCVRHVRGQLHYHPQTSSDQKGLASSTGSNKKGSSISDLHLFIKTIEKDLAEKFRNMKDLSSKGPATPKQILRKVED